MNPSQNIEEGVIVDQGSSIRRMVRAQGSPRFIPERDQEGPSGESTAHGKSASLGRKTFKRLAITLGALVAFIVLIGLIARITASPEEKARWAQERAARDQQRSESELKAMAAEIGLRYESDWGKSYTITAGEMGDKWPFIHETATVFCKTTDYGRPLVTISFDEGSTIFGLNGVALGKEKMMGVNDVRRRHVEYGTFMGDLTSLITRAIENCAP